MKRRSFLSKLPAMAASPFILNGIPVSLLANNNQFHRLATNSTNDRVLVMIQLHGGNDGLNAVIPIDQYAQYFALRPNIAISDKGSRKYITLDSTQSIENLVGIHPDMVGFKSLYDSGRAAIIPGVTYPNSNGSHFRSRDIWFMGGDYDEYVSSGWMGRYLDSQFPNFPQEYPNDKMADPPALEIGSTVSLGFHQENGIPLAIALDSPSQFYDLIKSVGVDPPEVLTGTHYYKQLKWIADIDDKSNDYAERLKTVFEKGNNTAGVNYPTVYPYNAPNKSLHNSLSSQLKLIARLIKGGCQTKIFLAKIGGFDTHAKQVESYDPSMGHHAALLYHLFSAVKAFQDDLKGLGLEDRVMTATFSEFGRRAKSNGSYGTDHGAAAPMFVFGKSVKPGLVGKNPDLSNLDGGNLPLQTDYRQVYTTLLQDWMGASSEDLKHSLLEDYADKKIDLVETSPLSSNEAFFNERFRLNNCEPNPAKSTTKISYFINAPAHVSLRLYDSEGKIIKQIVNEVKQPGEHQVMLDVSALDAGAYLYSIDAGLLKASKKLLVIR